MNARAQRMVAEHKAGAATVYALITILLAPITVVGYVLWIGKGYLVGRGSGVSMTAQGPLFARWLLHALRLRQDEPAYRLLTVVPGISHLALRMVAGPILMAHRLTGHLPQTFRYPYEGEIVPHNQAAARVSFFDDVVEQRLREIDQFVILGAGFDTRALRLPAVTSVTTIRAFEVDMPKTQATKRRMLARAGIDPSGVTFVSADFERDDWLARLVVAGFDLDRPALFIWEGVTVYLDKQAVEATLRKIAECARGSVVAFDYFTTEFFESSTPYWRYARAMTKVAGEPMKFGVDGTPPSRERLAELLRSCGLSLVEQRTFGQESGSKRSWGGFAVAAA